MYRIFSETGILVDQGTTETNPINVQHLQPGFYLLNAETIENSLEKIQLRFVRE